jgi:putative transposase
MFVSKDMDLRASKYGGVMNFFRPGKPTEYAFAEAFNSRVRAVLLSAHLVPPPRRHLGHL